MRDHEFRAWDKKHKKMIHNFVLSGNFKERSKRYIVMEYSGLRDRHGKKIFEGDFVKWDEVISTIGYKAGMFLFHPFMQPHGPIPLGHADDTDLEVVGNLFETNAQQSISANQL